jgi:ribA/ribD-fused uncharacterized protein
MATTEADILTLTGTHVIGYFDGTEYEWLSNFATLSEPILIANDMAVSTVEHAYQAAKAVKIADYRRVARSKTPGDAKMRGNTIQLRSDWKDIRVEVMMELLREKFNQRKFKVLLMSTGDDFLVEGNHWHDLFWGVCWCAEHQGMGRNWLGHLLMQVRDELFERQARERQAREQDS